MRHKSRSNQNAAKLLKQVEESEFEFRVYGVPKIRYKSYDGTISDLIHWDTPWRSDWRVRSWKKHRKTQFKP